MITLGTVIRTCFIYLFRLFPISQKKIFIANFDGKGYGDNPKYICEALLASDNDYEIVWEVDLLDEPMPEAVRKVKKNSVAALFEAATAKVWIENNRKEIWYKKRKSQLYIQTWHAGIGFKKAEAAALGVLPKSYIRRAQMDSSMADVFLSGSRWETDKYSKYYWFHGPIIKTGVPKQDILFFAEDNKINKLREQFHIPKDVHVVLYAPTFRKDMTDFSIYNLQWESLLKAFEMKFGGRWKGVIRLHPGLKNTALEYDKDRVLNLSGVPDSQEVLLVSDALITDYSSVIFDFAITRRPSFVYAPDLKEYKQDRDVYFDIEHLPFPFSVSQAELINSIAEYDDAKYKEALRVFLQDECGVYPGGKASSLVSGLISRFVREGKIILDDIIS